MPLTQIRRLLTLAAAVAALVVLAAVPALAADINLTDDGFEPAELTVDVDETVVWTNTTDGEQTIVGQDGSWDSGPLEPNETFSVSLRSEGTVQYGTADGEHLGEIIVIEGGAAEADTDDAAEEVADEDAEVAEEDEEEQEPSLPDTGVHLVPGILTGLAMIASGGLLVRRSSRR